MPVEFMKTSRDELDGLVDIIERTRPSGTTFIETCERWLEHHLGAPRVLLTHSCSAALEMAALLAGIGPGDEVIMPSFTCVSTANAVVLRGARPVFVDIRADTLNLDERLVEAAVTKQTRAIMPVHYAGVAAEMDPLLAIARRHGLAVIEDAAHGMFAATRRRRLGTIGNLGTISFNESGNGSAGEGGALIVNDLALVGPAERILRRGIDRVRSERGPADHAIWETSARPSRRARSSLPFSGCGCDRARPRPGGGGSHGDSITMRFAPLEQAGLVERPDLSAGSTHNSRLYRLLMPNRRMRDAAMVRLAGLGADARGPLRLAPRLAGRRLVWADGRVDAGYGNGRRAADQAAAERAAYGVGSGRYRCGDRARVRAGGSGGLTSAFSGVARPPR